jgi:hypothetical protein
MARPRARCGVGLWRTPEDSAYRPLLTTKHVSGSLCHDVGPSRRTTECTALRVRLFRRSGSVVLLAIGGLIALAGLLAAIATSLYFEYVGIKMMIDGQVVSGFFVAGLVAVFAAGTVNLISIPGAFILEWGERLWERDVRGTQNTALDEAYEE